MENKTKRDVTFLNLVSDFETNFEKGQSVNLDDKTFLEIIRFYEEELQYVKAIEVADLALSQHSYKPDFYIIKARLLFQTSLQDEALELLTKAEAISPFEHDILLLKIRILAFKGEITEAKNILKDMKRYVSSGDLSDVYLSESFINEVLRVELYKRNELINNMFGSKHFVDDNKIDSKLNLFNLSEALNSKTMEQLISTSWPIDGVLRQFTRIRDDMQKTKDRIKLNINNSDD